MTYITTYTGKHFDPVNPDASLLCIEDIAHALSLLCRGNGHVQTFFSVGQHCQLLDMIYMHFLGSTLDNAEQEILKDIDNAMLWYDLTYLLYEKLPLPKPQVYDEPDYTVRPFTDVEEEYLQIYRTFIQKLH